MMSVIRAFIALDIPREIQECLETVSMQLKEQIGDVPIRWVAPKNIHLTLKFLGDVSLNNIEVLRESIKCIIASQGWRPSRCLCLVHSFLVSLRRRIGYLS